MRTFLENVRKFLRLATRQRCAYPDEIQIEITNACNLTCAMCPHTFGAIPQENFPLSQMENLVRENPAPKRLILTGWGEPLLHPDFFSILDTIRQHWPLTQVRFTTNGILLDGNARQKIRNYGITQISVSFDLFPGNTIKPELQRFVHPASPKTMQNLRHYCEDKVLCHATPIVLQSLLLRENYEDIKSMISFAAEIGIPAINLVRLQQYPGLPFTRPAWKEEQQMIQSLQRLGRQNTVAVRSLNKQHLLIRLATGFDRICLKTDDSLYITLNGTATPCCNLRDYSIGALEKINYSITTAWNSLEEQSFFRHQSDICGTCDALFHTYRKE